MHCPELQDEEAAGAITNPLLTIKQGTWRHDEDPDAGEDHGAKPKGIVRKIRVRSSKRFQLGMGSSCLSEEGMSGEAFAEA